METNEKILKTIEQLGRNFFSIKTAATILEIDLVELKNEIRNPSSEIRRAYYKGFYSQELKLRESIIDLAHRGSSPAQNQALKFLESASSENG